MTKIFSLWRTSTAGKWIGMRIGMAEAENLLLMAEIEESFENIVFQCVQSFL